MILSPHRHNKGIIYINKLLKYLQERRALNQAYLFGRLRWREGEPLSEQAARDMSLRLDKPSLDLRL